MAKLSAHGIEIGRIEYINRTIAYFADGQTLKNEGFGWKKYGKIKTGITPQDAFNINLEKREKIRQENAAFRHYQDLMLDIPLSIRWQVLTAFEMMGDDIDGIFSTLDDRHETRGRFSYEDLKELADARTEAVLERKEKTGENLECTNAPAEVTA